MLQRVGRVNRVGTAFDEVFVFNFFPTAESDKHLGLEDNIKAKLQAFHNTLGEDAKYLSSDEEVSTHELFGDRLFRKLSNKDTYEGDTGDADESELKYLQVIRRVRDDAPETFQKIKRLPKKARSGRAEGGLEAESPLTPLDKGGANPQSPPFLRGAGGDSAPETLLTFFRNGKLKRFTLAQPGGAAELTFLDAAKRFECGPETPKVSIPPSYYGLLGTAKRHLETLEQDDPLSGSRRSGSNETFILGVLKSREVRLRYELGEGRDTGSDTNLDNA